MRIALVQFQPGDDLGRNAQRSIEWMREAAAASADVVCFTEVQLSPFFPQYPHRAASRWAVTLDHPAVEALRGACRDLGLVAFPNVYLADGGRAYDASLAIAKDGTLLGVSKMVHVVRMPGFYEQDYYTPSDTGFQVYDTGVGKVGVVICFDRHYPESIRTCVLRGAEVIVVPTVNTVGEDLELFEWEMRVAAVQSSVFVAMCNRVGVEGEMTFSGGSFVAGPDGKVLARAGDGEQLLVADLDLERIGTECERRQYLTLRRPEAYEP